MRMLKLTLIALLVVCLPLGLAADNTDEAPKKEQALKTALAIQAQLTKLVARVRPAYVMIGGGSGVLISADGYMLTNHHVAGRKKKWTVTLPSRKRYVADVVGKDSRGDLCLLKFRNAKNLPFVPLGDSDALRHGQWVVAIGNPWMVGRADNQPTVSVGIVSATHVYRGNYTDAIQTDAAINPGNSGGPLINMAGELVGINGQVAVRWGTDRINSGIGFAIPSNQIKNFMAKMKAAKGGDVPHGTLAGVRLDGTYHNGTGAKVTSVDSKSGAFAGGLRGGDRIVEVEGLKISGRSRLLGVIGTYPAGTKLRLKVARGEGLHSVTVALSTRKSVRATSRTRNPNAPFLGITISQSYQGAGVEVDSVTPGTAAEKADIKPGDIITHFNGVKVRDSSHLIQLISKKKIGDNVKVQVTRGLDILKLSATLGRRPR